ncbi:SCO family protein [Paucibacter sp. KBW04]|uniref:SCO family protein n=1 Tax=Paucibacter sp. KBW04 TaxID=2153361 RepID=UPI0026CBB963
MPVMSREQVEPLSLSVHSLPDPREMAQQQERTRSGRLRMLLVLAACAAPVIASYFTFYVIKPGGKAYSDLIHPTVDMPVNLHLRDLQGQPVQAESLKGQWLLTLVQSAGCDTACERQLFMQRQLREMLGKERDKVDKLLLISDEAPLRPELLQALTTGIPVTILRAPRAELEAFLKPAQGQNLNDHFYVIDPMGRWMMRAPVDPDPSKLKNDLNRLLKANAGWDKPGR